MAGCSGRRSVSWAAAQRAKVMAHSAAVAPGPPQAAGWGWGKTFSPYTHVCTHTHVQRLCTQRPICTHARRHVRAHTETGHVRRHARERARARTRAAAGAPGWWKSWLLDINLWQLEGLEGTRPQARPPVQPGGPPAPPCRPGLRVGVDTRVPPAGFLSGTRSREAPPDVSLQGSGAAPDSWGSPPSPLPARQEAARCRLSRTPGP